ncbi:ABC transporter [Kalamiella sp. sgz302252]|uniref:ABC transporter n=1 Tax=Pantoea sp. sgz302252 TaxID=3341827 RepID=UPI0036D21231
MVFSVVWIWLAWHNFLARLARACRLFRQVRHKIFCWLLRHCDYRWLLRLAALGRRLGLGNRAERRRAFVAAANKQCLIDDGRRLDYAALCYRRRLFELAATFGQNPQLLAQLERCKTELDAVVKPLHQAGSPVVLAPLHMVSDVLAGIVGSAVFPGKATVIVSASVENYDQQTRQAAGINLSYCSIHDDNRAIADNLTSAIMAAATNQQNIMLFPDITPDYTAQGQAAKSAKLGCRLFGRPARLHSGIIRIARALAAQVVFYYLYYDKGIKIYIYQPVASRDLKGKLPEIIEASLRRHPDDWTLWHSHSLFFINE